MPRREDSLADLWRFNELFCRAFAQFQHANPTVLQITLTKNSSHNHVSTLIEMYKRLVELWASAHLKHRMEALDQFDTEGNCTL